MDEGEKTAQSYIREIDNGLRNPSIKIDEVNILAFLNSVIDKKIKISLKTKNLLSIKLATFVSSYRTLVHVDSLKERLNNELNRNSAIYEILKKSNNPEILKLLSGQAINEPINTQIINTSVPRYTYLDIV